MALLSIFRARAFSGILVAMKPMPYSHPESGSVIIYIFMGVVLFAALGFAVSNMMRGDSPGKQGEVHVMSAVTIIQYAEAVRNAVSTMKIDGIADTAFCFDAPGWGNAGYNHAGCAKTENKVFDGAGGGVMWEPAPKDAMAGSAWLFTGANGVTGIGTDCAGADCADLKMVLPGIGRDVCIAIDAQLKVGMPGGEPPEDAGYDMTKFAGVYSSTATGDIGDEAGSTSLSGRTQGCFKSTSSPVSGTYHYYRVLLSR